MSSDRVTTGQSTLDGRRWDKGQRVVGAERQILAKDLVGQYADGANIRTLAVSIGRSYGFVHRVLTESGVPLTRCRVWAAAQVPVALSDAAGDGPG